MAVLGRMPAAMAAETGVVVRGRMARMKRMKADHVKSRDAANNGACGRMRCAVMVVLLDVRWSASQAFSDGMLVGFSVVLFVEYVPVMYGLIAALFSCAKCCQSAEALVQRSVAAQSAAA
jgi:hypothetical protein